MTINEKPIKPERPKVRYILDERELSEEEVIAWKQRNPPQNNAVRIERGSENRPIKPVRPSVDYR